MAYNTFLPELYIKNTQSIDCSIPGPFELIKTEGIFIFSSIILYAELINSTFVDPILSVGTNSPTYDNILPSKDCAGLGTTGKVIQVFPNLNTVYDSIPASTSIYLNLTTPATADIYNIQVIITGIYPVYDL